MIKCDVCNQEYGNYSHNRDKEMKLEEVICCIDNENGSSVIETFGDVCIHCLKKLVNFVKELSSCEIGESTYEQGKCTINICDDWFRLSNEDTNTLIKHIDELLSNSDDSDWVSEYNETVEETLE